MPRHARAIAAAAVLLALAPTASCAGSPLVTSEACIDWVWFETPADAAAEADAVALGRIIDQAGSTSYMDIPATTWNVEVDSWLAGSGDAEIVVTSLPRSCGDTHDTMSEEQGGDAVVLFLRDASSGWETITPLQGVVPATSEGGIPAAWPDETGN
ncbi:hypothetical protein KZC51_05545 [Microbacterium sp. SSW1-49]|uniref:Uncharacterized protein n=1 Tax=Microbacterium croceum TaxID=2851645 RepID=A0ABT0FCE0_9MICO|nr:hypothetical protein [Microbacterium croceum]MCK2035599.1 hypothetical protein [Microbacterium croceum]